MNRKNARENAFILIFEKIFNDELTIDDIVNNAIDARLIEENTFAFSTVLDESFFVSLAAAVFVVAAVFVAAVAFEVVFVVLAFLAVLVLGFKNTSLSNPSSTIFALKLLPFSFSFGAIFQA